MKPEKNWFYYFSVALAVIGMLYIIVCGFNSAGTGQEYPYLPKGMMLLGVFVLWFGTWQAAALGARFRWDKGLSVNKPWVRYGEAVFVAVVVVAAIAVRVKAVSVIPMEPASDCKTYYEIAELLTEGDIQKYGKGYCDYIAMFPHVMGYCYILMLLFKAVGVSVLAGQYLNIAFAVATVLLTYKIARRLGGRIAGLIALLLCAFWPSQILYCTMLSAENSFTFFFYLCVWLFLSLVMDYDGYTKKAAQAVVLHILLGVLLVITSAIRPMAILLLIAIVLILLPMKMKLPPIPKNDIALAIRFLEKGWVRCVLIIIPYMLISGIITSNIELAVDRTLPSGRTSFGYNLLVGLNTESKGEWSDEDAALLYSVMEETGSATQAHITCREMAFRRLFINPVGILNLFVEKYELLWGNDNYGFTWNFDLLKEQGNLTTEFSDFLYEIRDVNNILYIFTVFFAVIGMVYIWRGRASLASLLSFIYLGTVAMHLLLESQNRYHYFVLQIFMILAGTAVQYMFTDERRKRLSVLLEERRREKVKQLEEWKLLTMKQDEKELNKLRQEAFANVFDMQEALEKGHIIMTVTEACIAAGVTGAGEEGDPVMPQDKTVDRELQQEEEIQEEVTEEEALKGEVLAEEALEEEVLEGEALEEEALAGEALAEDNWVVDEEWSEDNWAIDVEWSGDDWAGDVECSEDDWAVDVDWSDSAMRK